MALALQSCTKPATKHTEQLLPDSVTIRNVIIYSDGLMSGITIIDGNILYRRHNDSSLWYMTIDSVVIPNSHIHGNGYRTK